MEPVLYPGDRLLIHYRRRPRPGDVVLVRFPDGTLAVKRADSSRPTASGGAGWWLLSDNPEDGIDSRHRGAFADEAVLGVVLLRVWPRPRLIARRTPL